MAASRPQDAGDLGVRGIGIEDMLQYIRCHVKLALLRRSFTVPILRDPWLDEWRAVVGADGRMEHRLVLARA